MTSAPFASLNPLVTDVGSPPVPEAQGWLARYDGSHGPVMNLSQAVPGSAPHPEFLARMAESAGSPLSARYGEITGNHALRTAYAGELSALYQGRIDAQDIAVTAGCNLAFFAAMMLLARHGDAILLPSPWYFNHQMSLDMLGIEARALPCRAEAGFVPRVEDAEALIDGSVKAIVLVTPNNPTGAVYPAHIIEGFADLCRQKGIHLVIDETYRDFLPQEMNRAHGLFGDDSWRDCVIQLYSFSKSYAIPGHRTGAITADRRLVAQIGKILDCIQICPPQIAQSVLPWAIDSLRSWREENRANINHRARIFREAMAPLPQWRIESAGAYFAYLTHPFPEKSAQQVAEALAVQRGVLALPGSYFGPGQERQLRVAFANVGADILVDLTHRLRGFAP